MIERDTDSSPERADLERLMAADLRAVTAQNDRLGRYFARENDVSSNDFRALLHVMIADAAGTPLTMAQLRRCMGVTPAAITYFVGRMIDVGHIRRAADPTDRRKVLLCCEESGMELAHAFSNPLGVHLRAALAGFSDNALMAAHRVLTAMVAAMVAFESELVGRQINLTTVQSAQGVQR